MPHELGLTNEEAEAIDLFRKLKPGAKQSALQVLRDLNQMVQDTIREMEATYNTGD